jgi:hypothetical protein
MFQYNNTRIMIGVPLEEDSGASLRDACKALSKNQPCLEDLFMYTPSNMTVVPSSELYNAVKRLSSIRYTRIPQSEHAIKQTLASGSAVCCGVAVFDSFLNAKRGRIPVPNESTEVNHGGHAITLTGYSDKTRAFEFVNSWGESVGLKHKRGYFTIPYGFILSDTLAFDFWSITVS